MKHPQIYKADTISTRETNFNRGPLSGQIILRENQQ